jgi:hypothetical protein
MRYSSTGSSPIVPLIASSFGAAIAVSGNTVHVVWKDNTSGNFDVFYRRSLDVGSTFQSIINLSSKFGSTGDIAFNPGLAAFGNDVHVVWVDDTPGNLDILYRRSTDGGSPFQSMINLSTNTGASSDPEIALSGSFVHVVWLDNTDNVPNGPDILYRRSIDSGISFSNIILNPSGKNLFTFSDVPAIAAKDDNVYVVWGDEISGNHEIVYRKSTDNGLAFDATSSNLSNNAGVSHTPAIAIS